MVWSRAANVCKRAFRLHEVSRITLHDGWLKNVAQRSIYINLYPAQTPVPKEKGNTTTRLSCLATCFLTIWVTKLF